MILVHVRESYEPLGHKGTLGRVWGGGGGMQGEGLVTKCERGKETVESSANSEAKVSSVVSNSGLPSSLVSGVGSMYEYRGNDITIGSAHVIGRSIDTKNLSLTDEVNTNHCVDQM